NDCSMGSSGPACSACPAGWFGEDCQDECPGGASNACNGNGVCLDGAGTGECVCADGWTGESCDECDYGYAGTHCSECPGGHDTPCSGPANGTCVADVSGNAVCECDERYAGADCSQCAPGYFGEFCWEECPGGAGNACNGNGTCGDGLLG